MPNQGRLEWRQCNWKWQHCAVTILAFLLLVFTAGCSTKWRNPQSSFDQAYLLFLHGDLGRAHDEAGAGYQHFATKDPEWAWKFRLLQAHTLIWRGLSQSVLELLNSDLPPSLTKGDLEIQKNMLEGLAHTRLGQYQEAARDLDKAAGLCRTTNSRWTGDVVRARGVLKVATNNLEDAKQLFRNSLGIARAQGDHFLESTALLNLGVVALKQEHFDEAIDWSTAARQTSAQLSARQVVEKALGNLAWAYYRLGDYERARKFYVDAATEAHNLGITIDEVRWSYNLGAIYYDTNQLSSAEEHYGQALNLARKLDNTEQITNALISLAFAMVQEQHFDLAEQHSREALDLATANNYKQAKLYSLLLTAEIAAHSKDTKHAEDLLSEVASDADSDTSLRWQAQNELARLYEAQNNGESAEKQYKAALSTLECARGSISIEESRLSFLTNGAHLYDDYIRFLVNQGKTVEALQAADYSRAQTLAEGLGVLKKQGSCSNGLKSDVNLSQAARIANGTIFFYWLGQQQSYLWAIRAGKTELIKLPPARQIETLVQNYRKALLDPPDVLQSRDRNGIELYNILVFPAQKLLAANSRVTIIADGALNNLNFETLLTPAPKLHYWIEDVTLTNASSLRMLAAARNSTLPKSGKLLLIGDPVVPDAKFPPLPSAQVEIQNVEKHFSPANRQVFSDITATPDAFLKNKPESFAYLHFVAHGTASQLSPLDSAVILSKATTEEDSYKLHARDIIGHPLHAELAVISTCYGSGTTVYNGEGLVGLSWAFLRAGTHNVIGALWAVSDTSTPKLMDQLYEELGKGRSPQDALRAAKLSLLHSEGTFRKPIYWAPFQLYTGS